MVLYVKLILVTKYCVETSDDGVDPPALSDWDVEFGD